MLVKKSMLVKNFGNVGEGYVGEEKHFHVCWWSMLVKKIVYVGEKFFECWWNSYVGEKSTFAMLVNNWKAFSCMLVKDVGESVCWWKKYVGEEFR